MKQLVHLPISKAVNQSAIASVSHLVGQSWGIDMGAIDHTFIEIIVFHFGKHRHNIHPKWEVHSTSSIDH